MGISIAKKKIKTNKKDNLPKLGRHKTSSSLLPALLQCIEAFRAQRDEADSWNICSLLLLQDFHFENFHTHIQTHTHTDTHIPQIELKFLPMFNDEQFALVTYFLPGT